VIYSLKLNDQSNSEIIEEKFYENNFRIFVSDTKTIKILVNISPNCNGISLICINNTNIVTTRIIG